MKVNRNLGMMLLSVWLILAGLERLIHLSFRGLGLIMAILALAAGVVILLFEGSRAGA